MACYVTKLDAKHLFNISRQIDVLFTAEESRSLHKLLYPDENFSIAFQILHTPLSYIPAVLRVVVAGGLTIAAWFKGNPNPLEPIRRSCSDLINKTEKDLTRLIVFANYMLYLPYLLASTAVKTVAFLTTMTLGRLAGIFSLKPAHFIHQLFAGVHSSARSVTEYFYPTSVLKSVEVAHPNHTMKSVEESYVKLMKTIGVDDTEGEAPRELAIQKDITVPFIFCKKGSQRFGTLSSQKLASPCTQQLTVLV